MSFLFQFLGGSYDHDISHLQMPTITVCPDQTLDETNLLATALNRLKFRCKDGGLVKQLTE